jgi:hypothetical protein
LGGEGGLELSDASIKAEIEHQQYKITEKREIALWEDDKNSMFAGVSSEVRGILDEKLVNSILELSFFFKNLYLIEFGVFFQGMSSLKGSVFFQCPPGSSLVHLPDMVEL